MIVGDGRVHVWCCNDTVGLCGEPLTGEHVPEDSDITCWACRVAFERNYPCPVEGCVGARVEE